MTQFNLYVHGVPIGHEICGCDEELDYIKEFYNHDDKATEASLLQIDIVGGKSFCTYLRKKNVRNAEGRPGSYFGMTVSFPNMYCTNVRMLYEILDTIFKKVCVGCLIKSEDGGDRFLVKEIASCKYGNYPLVDFVNKVFKDNLESLRFEPLTGFANSYGEAKFSLKEVDSPLFCDTLRKKRIVVSPDYETASIAYNSLLKELKPVKDKCESLTRENNQLAEEKNRLTAEVARLEKALAHANTSAKEEYKKKLEELKAQLDKCEKEKADLSKKIEEATSAVDLMDEPFKKLARLSASRFQEGNEKGGKKTSKSHHQNRAGHSKAEWFAVCNLVLLLIAVFLCCFNFHTVSKLSETVEVMQKKMDTTVTATSSNQSQTEEYEESNSVEGQGAIDPQPAYDNLADCVIDVTPSPQGGLIKGKTYTLSVKTSDYSRTANVPNGTWEVSGVEDVTVNENILTVLDTATSGMNVLIKYNANGQTKARTLSIK